MLRRLAGTLAVITAATALAIAAPPAANAAPATEVATVQTARPQLIRTKIYWGRCKDSCRIKVRIKNISYKRLFDVRLSAKLRVNGRYMGSCSDYVGRISPRRTRWAACTVDSGRLERLWDRYLNGEIRWDTRVNTVVHYEWYG